MQIKAHEEYDPSNYAAYAITSIKEDFTINLLYPSGFIEYTEYDLYDIGDQILIAFLHLGVFKNNYKCFELNHFVKKSHNPNLYNFISSQSFWQSHCLTEYNKSLVSNLKQIW
jgi:hypothetical protein